MNPFHLWLGLPEKATNPNHYQLLGIKPSVRDAKVIELAARTQIAKLDAVQVKPNHADAHKKIKQRIVKAHAVLTSENKRTQYDAKLKALLAKVKKNKASASAVALGAEGMENPALSSPTIKQAPTELPPSMLPPTVPEIGVTPTPTTEIAPTQPPASPVEAAEAQIPMAVPIQSNATSATNTEEAFSLTNAPKGGDGLDIKRGKLKRKRKSWLIPILGLLICLGGISGLAYIITNLENFSGLTPSGPTPVVTEEHSNTPGDVAVTSSIEGKTEEPVKVTPEDIANIPTELGSSNKTENDNTPREPTIKKMEFPEQVRFRRHMENARRAMYRRDPQFAKNEIQNAQMMFRPYKDSNVVLPPAQIPMKLMAEGADDVLQHLDGFWKQVVSSAKTISGGQPIEVNEKTLGFVEGTDEFTILRLEGSNVVYKYDSMPPGIALALAEQGPKADLPTYRLQKAAFYAAHTHLDPIYRERAKTFAGQAAEDGHNAEPIKDFVSFDSASVGIPMERVLQPPGPTMKKLIPKLMVRLRVNDLSKMRQEQAAQALQPVMDAAVTDDDDSRRAMTFEVAYMLAVKSGDVRLVKDVLSEYRLWTDYNHVERAEQALLDVSKQELNENLAKLLLRDMIAAAKLSDKKKYKKKLFNNGKKVAEKFALDSYLARLTNATK